MPPYFWPLIPLFTLTPSCHVSITTCVAENISEKYKPFWLVIFQVDQFPALFFHVAAQTAMPARTEREHTMREGVQGLPAGTDAKSSYNTIFSNVIDPQEKHVFIVCLTG